MTVPANKSGFTPRAAGGVGGVELLLELHGDAYDGGGPLVSASMTFDIDLESAYGLAIAIIAEANVRREREIADIREDREKWGLHEHRTVQEIEDMIGKLPGPYVVAKARKLTDDEKASRAK